jgi:exosome complex component RRP46
MVFTNNPRTLIQLVVQSLTPQVELQQRRRTQPSLLAAYVNASMLALLNASSFPLRGVICAIAVGSTTSSQKLILDPGGDVLSGGCFAFMFGGGEDSEVLVWTDWKVDPSSNSRHTLDEAMEMAQAGSRLVYATMKSSIESRYSDTCVKMETY